MPKTTWKTANVRTLALSCALVVLAFALLVKAWPGHHRIARLACPGGEFVIDARSEVSVNPFRPTGHAVNARLHLRYRYRGIELFHLRYSDYHEYLSGYLHADTARMRKLGGSQEGHTLYLPPERFNADEANRLVRCLRSRQSQLRQASSTVIHARYWLLWKKSVTLEGYAPHDLAHLVHADPPFADIYGHYSPSMIIERSGRVLLLFDPAPHPSWHAATKQSNLTVEVVPWGEMLPPRWFWGKPRVRVDSVRFGDKTYDRNYVRYMLEIGTDGFNGKRFSENYELMPP